MYVFHRLLLFYALISTVSCITTPKRVASTALSAFLGNPRYDIRSLLPASRTSLSTTTRAGFTFDDCKERDDCNGDRLCFAIVDENLLLCDGEDSCVCGPQDGFLERCLRPADCEMGELCAQQRGNQSFPFCYSADYIRDQGFTLVTDPPGDGYNRDLCADASDCRDDRRCMLATDISESCETGELCFCIPRSLSSCCPEGECIPQEVCAENTSLEDPIAFCVSPLTLVRDEDWKLSDCKSAPSQAPPIPTPSPTPSRTPTPSPSGQGPPVIPQQPPLPTSGNPSPPLVPEQVPPICISVHLLGHLPDSELVFRKHPWGKVLCDSQTSCASPGHIVVYKDKPMMMSSYCETVGCVERVMQVNSPRYSRKRRVPSMTDGLEFTAFSARYETSLEQHVIAMAVKMGL